MLRNIGDDPPETDQTRYRLNHNDGQHYGVSAQPGSDRQTTQSPVLSDNKYAPSGCVSNLLYSEIESEQNPQMTLL